MFYPYQEVVSGRKKARTCKNIAAEPINSWTSPGWLWMLATGSWIELKWDVDIYQD